MEDMKIAIVAITKNGSKISKKISENIPSVIFANPRSQPIANSIKFNLIKEIKDELFTNYDIIIFIMALGAVVRTISPYLKNKFEDQQIIAIDDSGKFVIPVIGGHHGSNAMAKKLANILNAIPVITTASELNNVLSIETIAEKYKMHIKNTQNIAKISGDIISGDGVNIINKTYIKIPELKNSGTGNKIIISYEKENDETGIIMVPEVFDIGIGFSSDASYSDLKHGINKVFENHGFYIDAIRSLSTIDIKRGNAGMNLLAEELKCPINYYTAEILNKNSVTKSTAVYNATGAYSVANAAARIASSGGKELVIKEIINNVTVSVFLHGN
ncbi:cobalamin biosynthesis protein [Ferroplasma sp.]|uniref:cobalt-precorrin 5A hydrolase n=1 Tax=Ferroplasma sp. TaxID=2591003 RepID=UPI00307F18C2